MIDRNIVIMLCSTFLANTLYGLAAPFLPSLLEAKGVESVWTGIIFASYAVAMIVMSLVAGKIVTKFGHGNIIAFGALLMALSVSAFALAIYLEEKWQIVALGIGLRILQGK